MIGSRLSKIHGASRQSDSISPLRLLSSFPRPIAAHKTRTSGSRSPVVLWVLGYLWRREEASLQSSASSSKPGSISTQPVAFQALILFKSSVLCSHCLFVAWRPVFLWSSLLSLFLFLFWSVEIYLAFDTDDILPIFFLIKF